MIFCCTSRINLSRVIFMPVLKIISHVNWPKELWGHFHFFRWKFIIIKSIGKNSWQKQYNANIFYFREKLNKISKIKYCVYLDFFKISTKPIRKTLIPNKIREGGFKEYWDNNFNLALTNKQSIGFNIFLFFRRLLELVKSNLYNSWTIFIQKFTTYIGLIFFYEIVISCIKSQQKLVQFLGKTFQEIIKKINKR